MDRAEMWFVLIRGGSPAPRRSTTMTSMPRWARSKASVRPTGPAPTIKTSVSLWQSKVRLQNYFSGRILANFTTSAHFSVFSGDEFAEFCNGPRKCNSAEFAKPGV